ncbi:hypothetical protein [Persephonella sp.]|uniref:hypothetical protein n=1 Tax=Persephonella sp. TaxID=2060922 RepID=UPI0025FABB2F|nr:hypothetical protein [Persephonella sp.]
MNEKLFDLRRFYFSFLYLSFVYLGILLLILGSSVKHSQPDVMSQTILGLTGIVPAVILFLKKTRYIFEKKVYIKLLVFSQIPLIIGTVLSIVHFNYTYFLISYPIFLASCLLLLPTKKSVEREN